jgi:aminoglycoside phosphotransferase (APT) family kinase protein
LGRLPGGATSRFDLLSGGNSHITSRLRLYVSGEEVADYVVKVAQPDGPLAPYDVAHEAAMMVKAAELGAPAPEVVGCSASADGAGDFIIMRHVAGAAPSIWEVARWIEGSEPGLRLRVGESLLRSLKPLRGISVDEAPDLPGLYRAYVGQVEADVRAAVGDLLRLPDMVGKVAEWLCDRCDLLNTPPALYHGDFRVGNAVFKESAVAALLDWERAMIGHPLHDIAYFSLPAMKTGDLICGLLTEDELLRIYAEAYSEPLDLRVCAVLRIMSMFTEFCAMTRALARLAKGHGRINGARTLPLVARLHHDILVAIREWNDGQFHL